VSCLMDIAEAQMLVGESTAALQTARLLDGFWRMAALSSCAKIHLERTGKLLDLPQSFFLDDAAEETERLLTVEIEYRLFRLETAKLLIRSGYQDRAKEYLPDDDGEFLTTSELFDFNVETALHLLEAGRAEAARSHLQKITSLTQRYKTVRWGGSKDSFLRLAESCVAAGADESAITCHDTLGSLIDGWLKPDVLMAHSGTTEPDFRLGFEAGKLGRISSIRGDRKTAKREFSEALKLLKRARVARKKDQKEFHDLELGKYLKPLIQIGTWQLLAGLTESGRATLKMASNLTSKFHSELSRRAHRKDIAVAFGKGREFGLADEEFLLIDSLYWQASVLCDWADEYAERQDAENAAALLRRAEELAAQMRKTNNRTSTLLDVAERWSHLGQRNNTLKCIDQAMEISEATDSKQHHQEISFCQIRVGELELSYQTISGIDGLRFQLMPLGKLAKALAERSIKD
ncbi:MAG: hypothetical protein ACI92S_005379, partial [Planctomycetaceae bacterium]